MTEHMLQSAYAAEQDGAPQRLVAAALLHDYGHFIHEHEEDAAEHGIDTRHEDVAHAFLSEHFGPEIAEPIRLHVAAKRYLCATDPSYLGRALAGIDPQPRAAGRSLFAGRGRSVRGVAARRRRRASPPL